MDWLDEIITRLFSKNRNLNRTLFLYLFIGIIITVIATGLTYSICVGWERLILDDNQPLEHYFDIFSWQVPSIIPKNVESSIRILEFIKIFSPIIYGLLAVFLITKLFYKHRIVQPLEIIEHSIQQIKKRNYNQPLYFNTYDEFEGTVQGLDSLRQNSRSKEMELSKLHQEQRKINAAFSHDLRTPLAIIQNNIELLEELYHQDRLTGPFFDKSVTKIKNSVNRLVDFSQTMQEIQKIDEIPLEKTQQSLSHIEAHLHEFGKTLSEKKLSLQTDYPSELKANYDIQVVDEVMQNLLSNASRFAATEIEITMQADEKFLCIFVKDDGKGFSKKELEIATDPYYSHNKESHFGLGLTISEILTKKHGGALKLSNSVDGGAIVTSIFSLE
ncbi:sensor histidine kinase [Bacillus norwichensis]|uniref:histidine kinase n=1 Tax=Bacillus norwichensis TaxID=2762217 RepID=A0ABR8VGD6_9BACI|nr:HAMP domain-containing sensor histidine kinase [Bacillus norwichensis]MBD8003727.1 HAMP domain-containing histidine kinase [Bacillus norwichensis]